MLCLGLGLGTIACGDDDDSASNGGSAGKDGSGGSGGSAGKDGSSGKTGGSGGDTASGSSGSGGDTASGSGGDTASGSGGMLTPEEAAAGGCDMMGMSSGSEMCTGIDDYTECAMNECDLDECTKSGGDCADLLDCYQKADDPCSTDCEPSQKCMACLTANSQCTIDKCISKLQCGTREDGGACDMLEDCCKDMMDSVACTMANVIVVGGDEACQSIVDFACGGDGAGTAGMGGGAGDGAAGSTGGSDKTCDDLKACCDGLDDAMYKMICMDAYDAAQTDPHPDMVCGEVYPSLTAIGCK
jgi:hypothetical protein